MNYIAAIFAFFLLMFAWALLGMVVAAFVLKESSDNTGKEMWLIPLATTLWPISIYLAWRTLRVKAVTSKLTGEEEPS